MVAILAAIATFATAMFGFVADVFGLVETQPVLQIGIGIFVLGAAVGIVTRVVRAF